MRTCDRCGKEMYQGFTNMDGDMCVCDDCFESHMDETYGKNQWKAVDDDGYDGYYLVKADYAGGRYIGTGIYWTEWEEDDEA